MTALKSEHFPLGPLVKLLLITGQRRSEIAEMKWSEVDLDAKVWTLPKERAKNGREHTLPLPDDVVDILREVPRINASDLVFTANGVTPSRPSTGRETGSMRRWRRRSGSRLSRGGCTI